MNAVFFDEQPMQQAPSEFNAMSHDYINSTTRMLNWAVSPGATDYRLVIDDEATFAEPVFFDEQVGDVTGKRIDGLKNGKTYYWKIEAINRIGRTMNANGVRQFVHRPPAAAAFGGIDRSTGRLWKGT